MDIDEAFSRLERIPHVPSIEHLVSISQSCRQSKNSVFARRLQTKVSGYGLEINSSIGNYLVPMLVDYGLMPAAHQAFHKLLHPNDYSWSSLIQGHVECSRFSEAFDVYMFMRRNFIYPGKYASVALLKACARLKCINRGQELYAEIVKMGCDDDLYACNSLLDMYAKSGCIEEAEELFGMMPVRDKVSCNCLISGYLEHGLHEEALLCLEKIQSEDLDPTPVTYVCGLKASSCLKAVARGQEIHAEIVKDGQEQNTFSM